MWTSNNEWFDLKNSKKKTEKLKCQNVFCFVCTEQNATNYLSRLHLNSVNLTEKTSFFNCNFTKHNNIYRAHLM